MSDAPKTFAADIIRAGGAELTTAADLYGASIDRQIATAKHYPRNLTGAMATCRAMASMSVAVADSCEYALPRDGKQITGPSARFAEILAYNFGNCRVEGRIIEIDKKHVTAQGVFHDLEGNGAISVEVKRRITNKSGQTYGDDMIQTTCQAAISIARRNAILAGIPEALWLEAYEAAQEAKLGSKADLPQRIKALLKAFEDLGVAPQRVLEKAGYEEADQFTANKLAYFRSVYVAIKEGHQTLEEAFPRKAAPGKRPTLDDLAAEPEPDRGPQPTAEDVQQAREEQAAAQRPAPDDSDALRRAEEEAENRPKAPTPAPAASPDLPAPAGTATPTPVGPPPVAVLEGAKLKAHLDKYVKRITASISTARLDDEEAKINTDQEIPDSDAEDLLDLLSSRRAELEAG